MTSHRLPNLKFDHSLPNLKFDHSLLNVIPSPALATSIADAIYDGLLLVTHNAKDLTLHKALSPLVDPINAYLQLNEGAKTSASLVPVSTSIVPSGRLILSCTGPVSRDYDDVRRFSTAASRGMQLALSAGIKSPLLITVPHGDYANAELVSLLGALHPLYVPLNVRVEDKNRRAKVDRVGVLTIAANGADVVQLASAISAACIVTTDIGDSDPQRMAPPKVAEYVEEVFKGTNVHVTVESDQDVIQKEYPLMAAVNRAANCVPEHRARLIALEYVPEGPIEQTLMLVGKGVTIDTGGTDVKTGGHMLGMCRDKYGSAIVAGFFKALEQLKPKRVKVVGYMCMVRNSIGSHSYTCDEIITSRSGKRIHIYNTDAEGRLAMLDPLTKMRERAVNEINPHLMTLATLTGHAVLTMGYYATFLDNGPALRERSCYTVQETAEKYGQPIEVSRLRHEDFAFHIAECEAADLRQGANVPSVVTMRGHQAPAAFLTMGARLDEYGNNSTAPIKYTHIDIGAAEGEYPQQSTPNPLVALIAHYIIPRV
jgi:leucyl aminopeptidase